MSASRSAGFLLVSSIVVWTALQTTSVQTQNQQRGVRLKLTEFRLSTAALIHIALFAIGHN